MRYISRFLIGAICCSVLLAGCGQQQAPNPSQDDGAMNGSQSPAPLAVSMNEVSFDSEDADTNWDEDAREIVLNGDSITFGGTGAAVQGSTVTITEAGTYIVSGSLDDGAVVVDTDGVVHLILNGAEIHCADSAPIYIKNAEKTVLTLAEGTENTVTDGDNYVYSDAEAEEPNAAIFSKDDLTINGSGSLTVGANFNNAVTCKDDLKVMGGTLDLHAPDDGLMGRDMVAVQNGTVTIEAGGDGIKSTNTDDSRGFVAIQDGTFNITAGTNGIQAHSAVLIGGGVFTLVTGGGSANSSTANGDRMGDRGQPWGEWGDDGPGEAAEEDDTPSAKGIKAGANVSITGGTFTFDTSDDAIHSNTSVTIDGGVFNIASGDDGIHADATLALNGGDVDISQSYEGLESAVIDINAGDIRIIAKDDGINVAGGNDGSSMNGRPGQNELSANADQMLSIDGGYIVVDAGGDGLDSNGNLYMTGGTVIVNGPTGNGNSPLDYNGTCEVNGGVLIAVGSAGMAQAPSGDSTQYAVLMDYNTVQNAGLLVHLEDSEGNDILTFGPAKEYQSLLLCSPVLQEGETYTLYAGGESTGGAFDGVYQDQSYTGGTKITDFTISDMITYLNNSGVTTGEGLGQGQMPGGQGPGGPMGQGDRR